ncbi:MAG: hypothetical protein V7727_14655 [Sneathiella sp.]
MRICGNLILPLVIVLTITATAADAFAARHIVANDHFQRAAGGLFPPLKRISRQFPEKFNIDPNNQKQESLLWLQK